ncbi:MAG: VPLPA-CTERM sorting domain-containing protein [Pseudomonadota bacterium]
MKHLKTALIFAALAMPVHAGTVYNIDLSSEDAFFTSTSYASYDGLAGPDTEWSVAAFVEIESADGVIDAADDPSEILDWGVSFTDGNSVFTYGDDDAVSKFVLKAIVDDGGLRIERFAAKVETMVSDIATQVEVFAIEFKNGEYLTRMDGFTRTVEDDFRTQSRGFKANGLSQDQVVGTIAPVPLPAAGWVLLASLGGLVAARRTRKAI